MRRELVEKDRRTHLPHLSLSVNGYAVYLDNIARTEQAVKVGEEAVEMRRELVKMDSKHTDDLIMSLRELARYLKKKERYDDARTVEEELSNVRQRGASSS
ncbi:hypothetical protein FRC02_007656 [Tulasnella sp. 418]|nr:hypothetical protein FRC02_007656 [Tulasnella sp. 418]